MLDPIIFSAHIEHYPLQFKHPAGTSRGVMHIKNSWFVYLSKQGITGVGEISIIEGLSPEFTELSDFIVHVQEQTTNVINWLNTHSEHVYHPTLINELEHLGNLSCFPSILFGLETALLDWQNGGKHLYFDNAFSRGEHRIPINGLIWMGNAEFMLEQVEQKLAEGYTTIKLKIGALDWKQECQILKKIRKSYSSEEITLRVDANGGFQSDNIVSVLDELAALEIHSIEQPIPTRHWREMAELCAKSPLPIALDEELIGLHSLDEKSKLLDMLKPQFIVLKPSLHGGISGTKAWIKLCEERKILWWMTSALESNVGLSAIAQFCGEFDNDLPQGLGTGSLYLNNTESSLNLSRGYLSISVPPAHL
jgi:O-succinylbenzoate synthase